MNFLVFTLYAPMSSAGEIACGERRLSWPRPARSAVLGLVGGALGYTRDNPAHAELSDRLHYAIVTEAPGRPFLDYQVVEAPKAKDGPFVSRRDEVVRGQLQSILSVREWRSDAFFTAVLWPRHAERVDLEALQTALLWPRFTPYLGRKSAVLGLPLAPQVWGPYETLQEVVWRRIQTRSTVEQEVLDAIRPPDDAPHNDGKIEIAFDLDGAGIPTPDYVQRRRDQTVSWERHQFTNRAEGVKRIHRLPPGQREQDTPYEQP